MTQPLDDPRRATAGQSVGALTPKFLAPLNVPPNSEDARRRRWARVKVLAASPEHPELQALIRESQNRIHAEQESLIESVRSQLPGRHLASARLLRTLNQNVLFGFVMEDLTDDPVSDAELYESLVVFYERMYDRQLERA